MEAIRIPDDGLDSLKVLCGEADDEFNLRAICDFVDYNPADTSLSPDQIEITWDDHKDMHGFVITCDKAKSYFDQDTGELMMSKMDNPWVMLNAGGYFPFPPDSSTQFRIPIDFVHLHTISIGDVTDVTEQLIPRGFWRELGSLKTLQVVQLDWASMDIVEPFLYALARDYDKFEEPASTATSSSDSPSLAKEQAEQPSDPPFPALRAILFGSMEEALQACATDLRYMGYEIPGEYGSTTQTMLFFDFLGCKLTDWQENGGRWLDCLTFSKGGLWSADPQPWNSTPHETVEDLVGHINHTAKTVILGAHVYTFASPQSADGQRPATDVPNKPGDGEPCHPASTEE